MRFFPALLFVTFLGVPAVPLAQQGPESSIKVVEPATPGLKKIKHVEPVYPEQARQARIQGTVGVQITVGTDGRVSSARLGSTIPMLGQAVLDAVQQWTYDPSTIKTPVTMNVYVRFSVATEAPAVAPRAAVESPPASSSAGGAQRALTAPLTTPRGFTVDVPADWKRYESGGWHHAESSDGQARVAIADDSGGTLQSILSASEPHLQSVAHGEGRIFHRPLGQPGGHVIYVQLNKLVTLINCQEKKGAEGGASGCLTIAKTARFVNPASAGRATGRPAASSAPTAAPSNVPGPSSPISTAEPDVLDFTSRDFGNVVPGTTKIIRFASVVGCTNPRIIRVVPEERRSDFRIMSSEPAMGRTVGRPGAVTPIFECPSEMVNCVIPFSFSPATPISRVSVVLGCEGVNAGDVLYGTALRAPTAADKAAGDNQRLRVDKTDQIATEVKRKAEVARTASAPVSPPAAPRATAASEPRRDTSRRSGTVAVTSPDGFTVDVPASWQISRVGKQVEARPADGLAFYRYGGGSTDLLPRVEANSMYTRLDHPEGRIFYFKGGGSGRDYRIFLELDGSGWMFDCRERPDAGSQPGGCLSIARSARIEGHRSTSGGPRSSVPSAAPSPPAAARGITGCWVYNTINLTIHDDGRVTGFSEGGRWSRIGDDRFLFTGPPSIDTLTLSPDGGSLSGSNNYWGPLSAQRSSGTAQSVVGAWNWPNGATTVLSAGGEAQNGALTGKWAQQGGNAIRIVWNFVFTDDVTLSPDGQSLAGKNMLGTPVGGRRIPCSK